MAPQPSTIRWVSATTDWACVFAKSEKLSAGAVSGILAGRWMGDGKKTTTSGENAYNALCWVRTSDTALS
ncbi:MAG: hypothetical protein H6729_01315 [Deltaproteobacteria bacterium]|nr:hypothetical protein [Deltaproteobacteria bacterium]